MDDEKKKERQEEQKKERVKGGKKGERGEKSSEIKQEMSSYSMAEDSQTVQFHHATLWDTHGTSTCW